MNIWEKMKSFVNEAKIGEIITRQDLLRACDNPGSSTVDNYRNYLTNAGYLNTRKRGRYEKLKHIEESLSVDQLYKKSYPEQK